MSCERKIRYFYIVHASTHIPMLHLLANTDMLHLFLEDPLAYIICQILPKHLDWKILLHSGVWIVTTEVGMV